MPALTGCSKPSSLRVGSLLLIYIACSSVDGVVLASEEYSMTDFQTMPISIVSEGVTPKVMIATSNDHQLYYAAYNDYTDLDDDGVADTTYSNDIEYYGYFDSYKCYGYSTSNTRFEPAAVTADKYCNAGDSTGQWSGNFLNWVSMSRIDTIRKILFGGHRRVDSSDTTVLERAYLPHDVHSWAKFYGGIDLPQLTPFTRSDYYCDEGNLSAGCAGDKTLMGITFGNTTDVDMGQYNNTFSEEFEEPPLIKVVKGNYSLWASNEGWQCTWASNADYDNHSASNANDPAKSGIYAHSSSPSFTEHLGQGNYIARVQVCVKGLLGEEKCKSYPGVDAADDSDDVYKPIGLLQTYGDNDQMEFGMIAGSYKKHASGGVLIRNTGSMTDEINVDTDGTFSHVAEFAVDDGVSNNSSSAQGLINAWSLYRITGYDGDDGDYEDSSGDNCPWGTTTAAFETSTNRCHNWVNPFSEIYYQAINYFSGNGVIGDYRDNSSSTKIPGLPVPQNFEDPLDNDNYCADLYVINLNSSTSSYDYDELDAQSYGPSTIWDSDDLPGDKSTSSMTDVVGNAEGITGNSYFVGEIDLGSGDDDQLCTQKTITNFGDAGGMCPEAPRMGGSYRIAGLAYYAHVKDIRPESATGNRDIEGTQSIDTFSVALSPGTAVIEIPDPEGLVSGPLVTILPACRDQRSNPDGNCSLVAFKIVSQEVNLDSKTASGKFYINYEVSEMGGDFDQDMWGTLTYNFDAGAGTLSVTTQVHAQSSGGLMGFGYVISGTDDDGFHAHSGINGFSYTETVAVDTGSPDCSDSNGCNCTPSTGAHAACSSSDSGASSKTYTLGTSTASLLEDPLWYAAKYGGFSDSNDNDLPDLTSEWDSEINSTGESGSDGIPDNYFYATDPRELEDALTRVLDAIMDRTSSGTSAAVVSANVEGEGALYQAYYEPSRNSAADSSVEASWLGTVNALWLDSYGNSRQDCTPPDDNAINSDGACETLTECVPNGQLDNYCVDQVVASYYDEGEGRTRMRIYSSNDPDMFSAYSMQGVVTSFSGGSVTMRPNSMEGVVEYSGTTLTISPYTLSGTVTAYDATTGEVTLSIAADDWSGPEGETFNLWTVISSDAAATGYSTDSITIAAGTVDFTLSPFGTWVTLGDTLTLQTKNLTGASGESFSGWTITCLEGSDATGTISSGSAKLDNDSSTSAYITTTEGDFSSCDRALFATYDLQGNAGSSYSSWQVSNLENSLVEGTSSTTMTLTNDGEISFIVAPIDAWLEAGDQVRVANYSTTTVELDEVSYIWNAREQLYLSALTDTELSVNRDYDLDSADTGRFIITWVDDNLDGVVDDTECRAFETGMLSHSTYPVSYSFFDLSSQAVAEDLIDYIRGIEKDGSRNRTIQYSSDDTGDNVMRLGDIVNSTPTVVSSPQEGYDIIYNDDSYGTFKKQYINRRVMVYVGANDGLIHAFNGGFYNETNDDDGEEIIEYSTSGSQYDGTTAVEHPLGSELWAYAPMNLLPHLQWLKDANYDDSHVSFIDGKPRVFEAKIFAEDDDHPGGWGTVMVVGMNLGGGEMEVDVQPFDQNETVGHSFRSAYVIIDITNPEVEPTVLGEISPPDGSFAAVYPAVAYFQDVDTATNCNGYTEACNSWYLVFGTGPDNIDADIASVESSQTTNAYLFELQQLITGKSSPTAPVTLADGCEVTALNDFYNVIACDTGVASTFMGTPSTVDWDLDFKVNTIYFGLVKDADVSDGDESGRVMRMAFKDYADPAEWTAPVTFFNAGRDLSLYAQPMLGLDEDDNHWLYFGSGRYFSTADKYTMETQGLFGVKDYEDENYPITTDDLLNVSDAEVYTDGTLQSTISAIDGSDLATFTEIEDEIDSGRASGWLLNLPPITGEAGAVPSTRNVTRSSLTGGVLLTTVFQPSGDLCEGEGNSRLYGVYYTTGTGYPDVSILGTSTETVDDEIKYLTSRYIDLGAGMASVPVVHTGSGSGNSNVTVYSQMSTGTTIQTEVDTVENVRSGRISWTDQDPTPE
ncbi:PilC/PilY family type IV pilus protein [Desulfosediminicola flagellatus]|uniref:PilC/PilY family type IV pilus protein n=1 Tax=Desulfosediminicola flagellatus TaxID=2569541 RepID=UPI00142F0B98|nr:PilC/PilY family type IV pilus protein [Desulfosediminicola flagellatus]